MSPNGVPAPMPRTSAPIDRLFADLPNSYRAIAKALRGAILAEAPELHETIKWNNPFWVGRSDVLCLQCYDDHVNLGLLRGAELTDRFPRLEGTGRHMRHVKVTDPTDARSPELRRLIRAAARLDRASKNA
jgi:hypothetical protein